MASKDKDLQEELWDKYEYAKEYWADVYKAAKEDISFLYGQSQWPDQIKSQRQRDGQACLTLNLMLPFAHQVTNEARMSRPAIRVVPNDDQADIETAEVLQGVIRNIEKQSKADVVYDTGVINAVGGGIGWIVVDTDYVDEKSFEQEIYIERVLDFESVLLDPDCEELDGSDAQCGFRSYKYTLDQFKKRWPKSKLAESQKRNGKKVNDDEEVCVILCYYIHEKKETIYKTPYGVLTASDLSEFEIEPEILEERETIFNEVRWCKITEDELLEKGTWDGKFIPIVPVVGEEVILDGKREFHSLIRQAKDSQRMFNYYKSENTTAYALQSKAPYIGPKGSFKSDARKWRDANRKNYSTVEYDPVIDPETGQVLPPPTRQAPPQPSAAALQEANAAAADIRGALGMYESTSGASDNAISGIAVRNRQIYGDKANFHFMDNLATAIAQVGCIIVDLVPKIYSDKTIARIIGEDGKQELIPVNQPFVKTEQGLRPLSPMERADNVKYDGIYRLDTGKYDVSCDVGASYASKRQEFADKMTELIRADQRLLEYGGDLVIGAMDLPYAEEMAQRIKSQMPPELLGEDPQAARLQQAAKQMQQMNEQLLNMEAALNDKRTQEQNEYQYKLAEIENKRSEIALDAQKTKAEIDKIYADINKTNAETQSISLETIEAISGDVADLRDAVEFLVDDMTNDLDQELAKAQPQERDTMLDEEDGELNE